MSTEFYCKICDIPCTGKAPYDQHLSSAKHLKKAKLNESQTSPEQSTPSKTSSSSPTTNTRTPFASTANNIFEDSSISSPTLTISPETMRTLLEWNHPHDYKPYCDICQLPLYGENNADIHFRSDNKLHSQKLAAWKRIRENDAPYSCKVCSDIFSNENLMREHFISDNHANTIQQKSNLQKIIQIYETYNKLKEIRKQQKEASPTVDDDLSNRFQSLNVIDATTTSTPQTPKSWAISQSKFEEVMKNNLNDDD